MSQMNREAPRITILGAGTWGIALARVLSLNGHRVTVWSKFPEEAEQLRTRREAPNLPGIRIPEAIGFTADPAAASEGADYLMMVVPSIFVRETAGLFAKYAKENTVWINAAKGIESDTLMTLTEVIEDEVVRRGGKKPRTVAISGPTHAEEVARDLPTLIVCAGDDADITAGVQKLFEGSCIRPYTNEDKRGVQICGALKNVEALAVGIAKGLGYGDNTKAAMMTRGMEEIRRLGLAMGCRERTFFGLAGIGDLIVTATSNHSRTAGGDPALRKIRNGNAADPGGAAGDSGRRRPEGDCAGTDGAGPETGKLKSENRRKTRRFFDG